MAMQAVADAAVPGDRPGPWTHALMDLGASLCGPRVPRCESCPAERWCRFAIAGSGGNLLNPAEPSGKRGTGSTTTVRPTAPFPATSRWLRGQIVNRLRASAADGWVVIEAPIGSHDDAAVRAALAGLARDGLVELDVALTVGGADSARSRWLARLPLA
jgi:hypothetical protein